MLSVQLINIRSSIWAQQTWINIHLSLGGQNNSHPAALLSTNRRARSEGSAPLSLAISRNQWYLWLHTPDQWQPISKLQQSLYLRQHLDLHHLNVGRSEYIWSFPFSKRYLHITRSGCNLDPDRSHARQCTCACSNPTLAYDPGIKSQPVVTTRAHVHLICI